MFYSYESASDQLSRIKHATQLIIWPLPVCLSFSVFELSDYRQLVLGGLPQLEILDNLDADGRPVRLDVLADLPGEFLEFAAVVAAIVFFPFNAMWIIFFTFESDIYLMQLETTTKENNAGKR